MREHGGIVPVGEMGKKIPRTAILIAGAVIGILMLMLGNADAAGEREEDVAVFAADEMEAYARALEERICDFCEEVEGVGTARVSVSLESGYRRVYAQEDSTYVMVGSGASRGTVYLTDEPPRIGGIAVICDGGGDPTVCRRLIGLLTAAYGIGANKIYIAQAQS